MLLREVNKLTETIQFRKGEEVGIIRGWSKNLNLNTGTVLNVDDNFITVRLNSGVTMIFSKKTGQEVDSTKMKAISENPAFIHPMSEYAKIVNKVNHEKSAT